MTTNSNPDAENAEVTFEAALAQLEDAVKKLESGELALDDAISQFQTGMQLVRLCRDKLQAAEQKVEMVMASERGIDVSPFRLEE
ncbi:MAG: exodeoxyribonuclease VII small subunit [Bacilli bacterium]